MVIGTRFICPRSRQLPVVLHNHRHHELLTLAIHLLSLHGMDSRIFSIHDSRSRGVGERCGVNESGDAQRKRWQAQQKRMAAVRAAWVSYRCRTQRRANQKDGNCHEGRGSGNGFSSIFRAYAVKLGASKATHRLASRSQGGVCGVGSEGGRESSENELGKRTRLGSVRKGILFFRGTFEGACDTWRLRGRGGE